MGSEATLASRSSVPLCRLRGQVSDNP